MRQEFKDSLSIWSKCRDVVEGQEAIHAAGTTYLAKLSKMTAPEYAAYVDRALFYNATQRTVDAMTGLLFRKAPELEVPTGMEVWLEDVDLRGNTLDTFVEDVADEILEVGRIGILIEHPQKITDEDSQTTVAQAEALNLRPFMVRYKAESIISWGTVSIDNQKVLNRVILEEVEEIAVGEFTSSMSVIYRVLDLEPETGNYRQRVFVPDEATGDLMERGEPVFPMKNGEPMKRIPFVFISPKGTDCDIVKSPILDLVNVNLSHYKSTATLEHGAHFTGCPTPVITGHSLSEGEKLRIGSTEAWVFSEPEAEAFYLEFSGTGLKTVSDMLEAKEKKMATLGARMLAGDTSHAETEEVHVIKRQGENSALASTSQAISDGIQKALKIMADWGGIESKINFSINKDFIASKMDAGSLVALIQALQTGSIPYSVFVENLKKGELIAPDVTVEELQEEISQQAPTGGFDEELEDGSE